MDSIIEKCVSHSNNLELIKNFEKRKNDYNIWKEEKKVINAEIGTELDVRDTE